MKLSIFIYYLIICLLRNSREEISILEKLIEGITSLKNLNNSQKDEKNKTEDEIIIEENIYEMNSTKDFDLNIKINGTENNSLIILFYSEYCGHCQHFLPIYREISESLKNDTSLKFSKIQSSLCEDIFKKYHQIKIPGVPTIYLYQKGRFFRQEGPRKKDNVISFIYRNKNFECKEIETLEELSNFINQDIIFNVNEEKQYVLGIFKKSKEFDKKFIVDNFLELNSINNNIVPSKTCFYFFKDENINEDLIDKNNFYLKHSLYDKYGEIGDYMIYSYNNQKGLNTFNLFSAYLHIQNNYSNINEFKGENINKNIKIIRNKYKTFLEEKFLYKYYTINNNKEVYNFSYYYKKLFVFYYNTLDLRNFYIDEINYILSLNQSLNCDYLFVLFNTTNDKVDKSKRLSLFNMDDYDNTVLLTKIELNKTNLESKILEYIYKDRKHLIKTKNERLKETFKGIYDWLSSWGSNESQTNLVNLNNKDFEQELIDEINKTIIEDEKTQKLEQEKKMNQSDNIEKKNLKNLKNIQKRKKILDNIQNEDLGFNKSLILFPLFLIIYSLLFFLCYKYVFGKMGNKIFYQRLPTEDPKNK